MLRLGPKYRSIAEKIYDASVKDLLSLGAAGSPSEISSASDQEALGCWRQAWSASSLIELHHQLRA